MNARPSIMAKLYSLPEETTTPGAHSILLAFQKLEEDELKTAIVPKIQKTELKKQ